MVKEGSLIDGWILDSAPKWKMTSGLLIYLLKSRLSSKLAL